MISLFKPKERYAVATLMLGLDGRMVLPLLKDLNQTNRAIVESDGDFNVATAQLTRVARLLVDHSFAWRSAANFGEEFNRAADAGDYGEEIFTNLAQRYQSGESTLASNQDEDHAAPDNVVVMLTVGYSGHVPELEKEITNAEEVEDALRAMVALIGKRQVQLAHIHYAPAHAGQPLGQDQMITSFPELVGL